MKLSRITIAVLALVLSCGGCDSATDAEVSGSVTVNGQVPPEGSSITFMPVDGKGPTAGQLLKEGKYSFRAPLGMCKVDIRVPRPLGSGKTRGKARGGPGPGSEGGWIEESLPAKYNEQTELTFEVKPGRNTKDWELTP